MTTDTVDQPPAPAMSMQPSVRLTSLDAFRGTIMLYMASHAFGITQVAQKVQEPVWQTLAWWFEHVPWIGCSTWDMIQPSFMFMVGVALPYSFARRRSQGHSYGKLFGHALVRSLILVLL